ncbi:MAG: hypothetical protein V4638_04500 [Bacteroidota bacterium]
MKKYIYSIVLLAISSVILSSCGTLSITKRVHNKGYHVSYTKHYSESKSNDLERSINNDVAKSDEVQATNEGTIAREVSPKTENSIRTEKAVVTSAVDKTNNNTASIAAINDKHQLTQKEKNTSATNFTSSLKSMKVIFGNDENRPKIQKMTQAREGGLSWLWIVIVVVLLLWLLGFLGGLGNLIHLLLIVVLILLILWLLRII